MIRASTRGYTEAVRGLYFPAAKGEKGKILDEFTQVTSCHRKAVLRFFRLSSRSRADKRHGYPPAILHHLLHLYHCLGGCRPFTTTKLERGLLIACSWPSW